MHWLWCKRIHTAGKTADAHPSLSLLILAAPPPRQKHKPKNWATVTTQILRRLCCALGLLCHEPRVHVPVPRIRVGVPVIDDAHADTIGQRQRD